MTKFITGAVRSLNGHANVDFDNKYIVFGLENLFWTELLAPGMFIALSFILSKVKEDKTKEKVNMDYLSGKSLVEIVNEDGDIPNVKKK